MAQTRADELARLLSGLDGLLVDGRSLLAGAWGDPGWGAADCAVQAYLAYLPIFCPQISLDPYPRIQASIAATQARPAYRLVMGLP
jgi:glutathione S-transferase